MRQVQIITIISVIALLFISSFFIYNKQSYTSPFTTDSANEFVPESTTNEIKKEKVIMGFMGNKTEKYTTRIKQDNV